MEGARAARIPGDGAPGAVAGIGLVIALAAWRSSVDWAPRSLWLDDAWVVALARSGTWAGWAASPASAPPGFEAIVWAATALGGRLEPAAQCVPFAAGVVAIGLVGALGFRLTRSAVVGVCAAAWVGLDVSFAVHLARVKPYSIDVAVVAAQGLAFGALVDAPSRRALWRFVAVAACGLPFSTLSALPALAATAIGAIVLWRRRLLDADALAAGVLLGAALGATAALALGAGGAEALREYWARSYLPTRDLAGFGSGLARWLGSWGDRLMHAAGPQPGPLPLPGWLAAVLALLGGVELWLAGRRAQLAVGVLLAGGVVTASALRLLPLGVWRIEMFLLPFAAVLVASSAALVRRLPDRRAGHAIWLWPLLCAVQLPTPRTPGYPIQASRPVIEVLASEYRQGDGLWANLHGTYALALYGPWPTDLAGNDRLGIPHAVPRIEGFELIDAAGADTLGAPPDAERVFVFVCNAATPLLERAGARLLAQGYRRLGGVRERRCQMDWLVRGPGRLVWSDEMLASPLRARAGGRSWTAAAGRARVARRRNGYALESRRVAPRTLESMGYLRPSFPGESGRERTNDGDVPEDGLGDL